MSVIIFDPASGSVNNIFQNELNNKLLDLSTDFSEKSSLFRAKSSKKMNWNW